jgi:hydrogenase nickel incorporation protein HypB
MRRVPIEKKVLGENDRLAAELRADFESRQTLALNLISSPGSGKTSLLEMTLDRLPRGTRAAVLTGDIATENDARRVARFGYPVRQITTGGACHLDARMVRRGLDELDAGAVEILFIENVGNLVCPSSFDLGEACKIVVLSVTEGDDKPLKYPAIFARSELLVLNKIDLLPHVSFDMDRARENARQVNPTIEILELSCRTGEGLDGWLRWLDARRRALPIPS